LFRCLTSSGTSRWLNDPANRERLAAALELIADLRLRHASQPRKSQHCRA